MPSHGWTCHAGAVSGTHSIDADRTDWLKADMRCLMCGRVLGQLVSPLRPVQAATTAGDAARQFTTFRPADSSAPPVRLSGGEQFRRGTCGGSIIVDQQERFSIYAEVDEVEAVRERPRRGRPPKPWRVRNAEDDLIS